MGKKNLFLDLLVLITSFAAVINNVMDLEWRKAFSIVIFTTLTSIWSVNMAKYIDFQKFKFFKTKTNEFTCVWLVGALILIIIAANGLLFQ